MNKGLGPVGIILAILIALSVGYYFGRPEKTPPSESQVGRYVSSHDNTGLIIYITDTTTGTVKMFVVNASGQRLFQTVKFD